jgi:excisionase family DNA binding protein
MTPTTELLTADEAAARLGVEVVTLAKWRSNKRYRLAYTKIGGKVRYPVLALEKFIAERTVMPGERNDLGGRTRSSRRQRSEK